MPELHWQDHEPARRRLELRDGVVLHAGWNVNTQWWAMWLEVDGAEVQADPCKVLGGSFEDN